MKKLDFKLSSVAIVLIVLALVSYVYWKYVSVFILSILESESVTFILWLLLIITAIIHYYKNHSDNKNLISDNEGLEKPLDYGQFVFTYGSIITSIKILAKEIFTKYYFPDIKSCMIMNDFNYTTFILVVIVLSSYSYSKIKPVFQETYIKKEKIKINES